MTGTGNFSEKNFVRKKENAIDVLEYPVAPAHFTFNSRWMPNFSMRLRSVARVMPSSFAA